MSKQYRRSAPSRSASRSALLWFLAAVVALMAALMTYFTGHVSVLSGQRAEPGGAVDGTLHNSYLQLIPLSTTPLPRLRQAKLELVPDKKNSTSPTFRVLLVTDDGIVPMTDFSSGGRARHQELVDRINAQLHDESADSFSVRHVAGGWFALASATVLVVAMGSLVVWIALAVRRILSGALAPR